MTMYGRTLEINVADLDFPFLSTDQKRQALFTDVPKSTAQGIQAVNEVPSVTFLKNALPITDGYQSLDREVLFPAIDFGDGGGEVYHAFTFTADNGLDYVVAQTTRGVFSRSVGGYSSPAAPAPLQPTTGQITSIAFQQLATTAGTYVPGPCYNPGSGEFELSGSGDPSQMFAAVNLVDTPNLQPWFSSDQIEGPIPPFVGLPSVADFTVNWVSANGLAHVTLTPDDPDNNKWGITYFATGTNSGFFRLYKDGDFFTGAEFTANSRRQFMNVNLYDAADNLLDTKQIAVVNFLNV